MNLDDLTIGQAKELASMLGALKNTCGETLTKKGDKVFIRTLTFHYTGEVVSDNGIFIELDNCAWIADSGRFSTAISKGIVNDVEPIGKAKILYNNIIDCIDWKHDLPIEVK